MFKLFKNFSGEWILVPYDNPGLTAIAFIVILLLGAKFFALAGFDVILPILLAFVVPFFLIGLCNKLFISTYWLCILHACFIQKFIDVIVSNAIKGNPEGLGLINIVLLLIFLIIGLGLLYFISGDNGFPIFFVIAITNAMYYLSAALYKISFIDKVVTYSLYIQIILAIINQIVIIKNKSNSK